jgi:octaprenyl-diphosphate synthase
MKDLNKIREPIKSEIREFEKHFSKSMKSSIPLFNIITNYILRRKGKQIRPTLVLLSSSMLGGITESSYTAASLIELLHTASLVHDDVVDESFERRGYFSLNAIWKSKIAVLFGDYLLAKGLLLSLEQKEYELLEIVSEAVKEMSEGELLQLRKSWRLDITMDEYFEIIRKKTAALIAACTASGARAYTDSQDVVEKMKSFGYNLGIAFQIKDDLFDYERNGKIGKPTANDIK